MRKILFIGLFLGVFVNVNAQNGWVTKISGTTTGIYDIYFVNESTGWMVGVDGMIRKSTDGGESWFPQVSNSPYNLLKVEFFDENTGWAAGGEYYQNPWCQDYVVLLNTTNGGDVWNISFLSSIGNRFYDIEMTSSNTIYTAQSGKETFCMKSSGGITKTTDGGINWFGTTTTSIGHFYGFTSVDFINENTGWTVGLKTTDTYGVRRYLKTTDAGQNWTTLILDSINVDYNESGKINFLDEQNGYLFFKFLRRSTNGGMSWEETDSATTRVFNSYFFHNKDTGWGAGNDGQIYRTNNGGSTWSQQIKAPFGGPYSCVFFINANTGWAAGSNGKLLKTGTGGITSISNLSSEIPADFSLHQNYPNPFNPNTSIKFEIPRQGFVSLKVFDISGREVAELVKKEMQPGVYEYNFDGTGLVSGVYFYRIAVHTDKLQSGDFTETRRMVLVK